MRAPLTCAIAAYLPLVTASSADTNGYLSVSAAEKDGLWSLNLTVRADNLQIDGVTAKTTGGDCEIRNITTKDNNFVGAAFPIKAVFGDLICKRPRVAVQLR